MSSWFLVEDEPDLYDFLLGMIDVFGVEGVGFPNREEAIAWVDDYDQGYMNTNQPQLALLDIRLGPSDPYGGVQVSSRLRKSPVLKQIPIILMTAYRFSERDKRRILQTSGANLLLEKPLPSIPEFRRIVARLLS